VKRIVVEQHEPLDPRPYRDVDDVLDGTVAPSPLGWILVVAVLGVVDQQVDALHEGDVALLAGMQGSAETARAG